MAYLALLLFAWFAIVTLAAVFYALGGRRPEIRFGLVTIMVIYCIQTNTGAKIMSEVMTVRVEHQVKQRLAKLAKATSRSKSFLAAEAIRAYLDLNEWQISEIKAGLREADAGEFATDVEVKAAFAKK